MTWVIVKECEDCNGQGRHYHYNTAPDKCYECEGTGAREYYEQTWQYENESEVKLDYSNTISIQLVKSTMDFEHGNDCT